MLGRKLKRICCLADLHVLSSFGLSPLDFRGEQGDIYVANEGQRRLFAYWQHLCETIKRGKWKADEIWLVGDLFAGLNIKERGRKRRGTLDDQFDASLQILQYLPRRPVLKIWSGTTYHASLEMKMHQLLVAPLRQFGYNATFRGSWSFERLSKDRYAFVTHSASTATVYPHTPMLRDSRWFKVMYADGKLPRVSLIVRAHKHRMDFVDDRSIKIIQVPCFCAFMPYQRSLRAFPQWQPDIGAVFVQLDKEERISIQEWLYPPFLLDEFGNLIETPYERPRYVDGWTKYL